MLDELEYVSNDLAIKSTVLFFVNIVWLHFSLAAEGVQELFKIRFHFIKAMGSN